MDKYMFELEFKWLWVAIFLILLGYIIPYTALSNRPFLPALFWALLTLLVALSTYLHVRRWRK